MLRSKVKELESRLKKYTNGSNHKKYYEKNKERYKESGSEYLKKLKEENPERLKEYRKRAYEKRKEKLKEKEKCEMEVRVVDDVFGSVMLPECGASAEVGTDIE